MASANGSCDGGTNPYDKIIDMMKKLDLQDDGIAMNQKIKAIEQDFCGIVLDEIMLSDSMEYINDQVLSDKDASQKFALLFSSRNFDSLAMNDTKVRSKMLNILQTNFINSENLKKENRNKLFNSITLLGEYYHRVRLADGSPIAVLGESLLRLLTRELCTEDEEYDNFVVDVKLAKLILSQVTLNGMIMRNTHKDELNTLLFHIRRTLIETGELRPAVKALLLMTLDLHNSNFTCLGEMLENMYTKYLVDENEVYEEVHLKNEEEKVEKSSLSGSDFNIGCGDGGDICEMEEPKKKWSEQVFEDEINVPNNYCDTSVDNAKDVENSILNEENNKLLRENNSPDNTNDRYSHGESEVENYGNDDDRHSIRSEGGSIRLYNINERIRYSQRNANGGAMNGGGGGNGRSRRGSMGEGQQNYNNWDRNDRKYHTFDRNRRNLNRNHNNNNNQYENSYYNRNRTYNRPPRFSNNNMNNASNSGSNVNISNSESWRNGPDYNRSGSLNPDLGNGGNRSVSQNRNISRLQRNNYEKFNGRSLSPDSGPQSAGNSYNRNYNNNNGNNNNYRNMGGQRRQQSRNFGGSRNSRYGSHSSLVSESSTWERRGRRRNNSRQRGKSQEYFDNNDVHSIHDRSSEVRENIRGGRGGSGGGNGGGGGGGNNNNNNNIENTNGENSNNGNNSWDESNNEIAKNARDTAKYLQYLSNK